MKNTDLYNFSYEYLSSKFFFYDLLASRLIMIWTDHLLIVFEIFFQFEIGTGNLVEFLSDAHLNFQLLLLKSFYITKSILFSLPSFIHRCFYILMRIVHMSLILSSRGTWNSFLFFISNIYHCSSGTKNIYFFDFRLIFILFIFIFLLRLIIFLKEQRFIFTGQVTARKYGIQINIIIFLFLF